MDDKYDLGRYIPVRLDSHSFLAGKGRREERAQFLGIFHIQPVLLPRIIDRGVPGR